MNVFYQNPSLTICKTTNRNPNFITFPDKNQALSGLCLYTTCEYRSRLLVKYIKIHARIGFPATKTAAGRENGKNSLKIFKKYFETNFLVIDLSNN